MTDTDFILAEAINCGMDKSDSCRLEGFVEYLRGLHAQGATQPTIVNMIRTCAMADSDDAEDGSPAGDAFNLLAKWMDTANCEIVAAAVVRKAQRGMP